MLSSMSKAKNAAKEGETGHGLPTSRSPFRGVSVDQVEYKTASRSPTGQSCTWILAEIHNLMHFAVKIPLLNKQELTVAKSPTGKSSRIFRPDRDIFV